MFAFRKQRARYRIVCIGRRRHGRGIDHLNKFIERFGRCRAEFPSDGAAPERIYIIHCRELDRWDLRIQPRMVAPDMTNPDNSDAQIFHHRSQSTPKAFGVNAESYQGQNFQSISWAVFNSSLWRIWNIVREKPFIGLGDTVPQRD